MRHSFHLKRAAAVGWLLVIYSACFAQSEFWELSQSLVGGSVNNLAVNSEGDLFVATSGSGAYKSTDAGNNWFQINNGLSDPAKSEVHFIAVNPTNDDLFAKVFGAASYIYRSTDGGENWARVAASGLTLIPNAMAINSKGDLFATNQIGVFRSTDNGENWTQTNNGLSSTRAWGVIINQADTIFVNAGGVHISADNGESWRRKQNRGLRGSVTALDIDLSGNLYAMTAFGNGVFVSTDSADNWTKIDWPELGPNVGSLAFYSDGSNNSMYAGTVCGAYFSNDGGENWQERNDGLFNRRIVSLTVTPQQEVVAGTRTATKVFHSSDDGDNWKEISAGSIQSPVFSLASNSHGDIFVGSQFDGIYRLSRNSDAWVQVNSGLMIDWINALAVNADDHLFAGIRHFGVFRSTDNGEQWTQVNSGLTNIEVDELATHPNGNLFAGTDDGLFRSIDNGENWSPVHEGLTNLNVNALAINAQGNIFAGLGSPGGIFRSTNTGDTWESASNGYSADNVTELAIDSNGNIFASSHWDGLFYSMDNGESWAPANDGLRNYGAFVFATNSNGSIFLGTKMGVFRHIGIPTDVNDPVSVTPTEFSLLQNYPNPFNPETRIQFQLTEASHVALKIFNLLGQEIRTLVDTPYRPGYHGVRWDGKDGSGRHVGSGVYFYRITAGSFTVVKKMSLLR